MGGISSFKQSVKDRLIHRQHKKYKEALQEKKSDYHSWIMRKESRIKLENAGNLSLTSISFAECAADLAAKLGDLWEDIVVFHGDSGKLSKLAKPLLGEYLYSHPSTHLVYGDEDRIESEEEGIRTAPWFKPDWSPDTFLSEFYFGNIFAVRRKEALPILLEMEKNGELQLGPEHILYELCFRLAERSGGFERTIVMEGKRTSRTVMFPVGHIPEILFHSRREPLIWKGNFAGTYKEAGSQMVTVIIPTKDHPAILERCIRSFCECTVDRHYQFVIVDNGSSEENRKRTGDLLAAFSREFSWEYPPVYDYFVMPFNFSAMCNRGTKAALRESGLYLFLNDDVEICGHGWLDRLAGKALLDRTGAVGMKLLYPESDMIQHAGITNLRPGPAHKLQFLSDAEYWYYGRNRGVHNVLAVTGACLMVRRSVYERIGGFSETLAVAFNDVDFCYSLWEAGYVNIVVNDMALYHHESLSRGKDGESEEKRKRLMRESDLLFARHRGLYAWDPYYHKYLLTDMLVSDYLPACHYEVDLHIPWASVIPDRGQAARCREDACLRLGIERISDIVSWRYGTRPDHIPDDFSVEVVRILPEDQGYYLQGYSFVIGGDNACYERTILMKNLDTGKIWRMAVESRYRPDIREDIPDQLNADLTGFTAKFRYGAVPAGEYLFGMMVRDNCSRQRILCWSDNKYRFRCSKQIHGE